MNFLAHLLLSGEKEEVIMGNYVGDFVKGRLTVEKTEFWDKDYVLGLKLHRHIDSFTDGHQLVRDTKKVVALTYGKLSGIVLDIYFDYFLAKYFYQFCTEPLAEYAGRMYLVFQENEKLIPNDMVPMMRAMVKQDWLTGYANYDGMNITFSRLSRRATYLSPISDAVLELKRNENFYHEQFNKFFPELQASSAFFIQNN